MKKTIGIAIVGGAVATWRASEWTRVMRGYNAIGGEILIIPLAILIIALVFCIAKTWPSFLWNSKAESACGEEDDDQT